MKEDQMTEPGEPYMGDTGNTVRTGKPLDEGARYRSMGKLDEKNGITRGDQMNTDQWKTTISARCDVRIRRIAEVAAELCEMTLSTFVAKAVDEAALRVLVGDSEEQPSLELLARRRLDYMEAGEFEKVIKLFSELRQKDPSDPF